MCDAETLDLSDDAAGRGPERRTYVTPYRSLDIGIVRPNYSIDARCEVQK